MSEKRISELPKEIEVMHIFEPRELLRQWGYSFESKDDGTVIDSSKWPRNLVYNTDLISGGDDEFYEQMSCDTTLVFYIKSALGRCKSLISRALSTPDTVWEHGPIRIVKIEGDTPHPWMVRTRTEVVIRKKLSFD